MIIFTGRVSARREAQDAATGDEGIALAIAVEPDAAYGRLAASRKLTVKMIMPI